MAEYTLSELFYFIRIPLFVHLASFFVFFGLKFYRPPHYSDWVKRLHFSFGIFPFTALFIISFLAGTLFISGGPSFDNLHILAFFIFAHIVVEFFLFAFAFIAPRLQFFSNHPLILLPIYAVGTMYALWLALESNLKI